jgi:hypothetical protein
MAQTRTPPNSPQGAEVKARLFVWRFVRGLALFWAVIAAVICLMDIVGNTHDMSIPPFESALLTVIAVAIYWLAGKIRT